jgi:hypothetical protein
MLDTLNRAERYRELAEGCRDLAAMVSQPRLETTICGWQSITTRWLRPTSRAHKRPAISRFGAWVAWR